MNADQIVTILSSFGFPVVCCGALMWYVKYIIDKNNDMIDKITTDSNKQIDDIRKALERNTQVIERLMDKLS